MSEMQLRIWENTLANCASILRLVNNARFDEDWEDVKGSCRQVAVTVDTVREQMTDAIMKIVVAKVREAAS